ncbi:phosphoribosylaminoimidazolesuccinocarboxamide synthase [Candidatus Woesearchaeota archaeon]|nr:phosphoribosylaminoimidazolesuccinocarboxamide synthase [Candidatus Woesearchaeota archaeon]
MDTDTIRKQLRLVLEKTDFALDDCEVYRGKVRDNYIVGDKRIIVTTDRLSAFDVVLCTLPFKGQVLNQMSEFWFSKTKSIAPNHVIEIPDPNVTVARNCTPIPVEFVVRGYLTGVTTTSIWYSYSRGAREFCGHRLPDGLKKDQKLEMPIVTPSTKAEKGGHDESVSGNEVIKRGLMDRDEFDAVSETSLKLFELGTRIAAQNNIILVDTKYEFGRDEGGEIMLIDEMHTPDSSRFWYKDSYHGLFEKGLEQRRIDKEYVRKWLADQGYLGQGTMPEIPDEVRIEAANRYITAYEQVTGSKLNAVPGDATERIRKNLARRGYI